MSMFARLARTRFAKAAGRPVPGPRRPVLGLEALDERAVPATFTLFDTASVPAAARLDSADTAPVQLGVKFTVDVAGSVSQVKFFRQSAIPSGYTATIWKADGTLLSSGVVREGQSPVPGWQTVFLNDDVPVIPGQTYIASYHASAGRYSFTNDYFEGTAVDSGPLNAPASWPVDGAGNGVYVYSSSSPTAFPTQTYESTNYWVTPVLSADAATPTVTGVSPTRGLTTGGQEVTITGTNFIAGATRVFFGATEAVVRGPGEASPSTTTIRVDVPAGVAGTVDVRVVAAGASSANTAADDYTYVAPPAAPTGVTATAGADRVTVSWDAVPGATGYYLYRRTPDTEAGVIAGVLTTTTYTNTAVRAGQTYLYSVAAVIPEGQGARSAEVSATPGATAAPGGLTATANPDRSIRVTWQEVAGATGYNLYRSADGGPETLLVGNREPAFRFWNDVGGNAGLTPYVTYTYRVAAIVGGVEGPKSDPASASVVFPANTYRAYVSTAKPVNATEADTAAVEVGVKFTVGQAGTIQAIRFYRGTAIPSGYTVSLWAADGTLLGTGVAIEGQSPTPGWQTVELNTPVAVQAGQVYTASYYASTGGYAADEGGLANGLVSGPITFLPDGGVYKYGTGGGFPTQTFNATNYWVDVVFKV